MKIANYERPVSSFLSEPRDTKIIVQRMLQSNNLKKLLYYPDKNCLSLPILSPEQTVEVARNHIRNVPKIEIEANIKSYIIITFDNYMPSGNPEFRDNLITFDIICHMSAWDLGDFQTRPKRIGGEIDSILNRTKLTGIGVLNFIGGNQIILNEELAGFSISYSATHGKEDKI